MPTDIRLIGTDTKITNHYVYTDQDTCKNLLSNNGNDEVAAVGTVAGMITANNQQQSDNINSQIKN